MGVLIRNSFIFFINCTGKIEIVDEIFTNLLKYLSSSLEFLISLGINIFFVFIISKIIYLGFNNSKKSLSEFFFTYNSAGLITFLICFLLRDVELELGLGLGLFAIFAILRFRTETIKVKEMTYFFVIIGVSAINALSNNYLSLFIANASIIILLYLLEYFISRSSSD